VTTLLLAVFGTAALFCLWMLICNERTYRQRGKILDAIPVGDPRFWELSKAFDKVRYHDHMWGLALLQDPLDLYPPVLRERLK
jgi:hypothetical protein